MAAVASALGISWSLSALGCMEAGLQGGMGATAAELKQAIAADGPAFARLSSALKFWRASRLTSAGQDTTPVFIVVAEP